MTAPGDAQVPLYLLTKLPTPPRCPGPEIYTAESCLVQAQLPHHLWCFLTLAQDCFWLNVQQLHRSSQRTILGSVDFSPFFLFVSLVFCPSLHLLIRPDVFLSPHSPKASPEPVNSPSPISSLATSFNVLLLFPSY